MLDIFEVKQGYKIDESCGEVLKAVAQVNFDDFFKFDCAIQQLNSAYNIPFSYFEDCLLNNSMIEAFITILQNCSIDKDEKTKWLNLMSAASKNNKWLLFVCD